MRIIYNPKFKQFETHARVSSLSSDVEALKKAGWKTEGPPSWDWVAFRAGNLVKLKKVIPSGITVTPEALERFKALKEVEDKNLEVKAALKAHRKELNLENPVNGFKYTMGPEGFVIAEVEPEESDWKFTPVKSSPNQCSVCQTSIYDFERQDPPTCLDCEFDPGL